MKRTRNAQGGFLGALVFWTQMTLIAAQVTSASASEVQEFLPLREGREWSYRINKVRTYVVSEQRSAQQVVGTSEERCTRGPGQTGAGEVSLFVLTQRIRETNQTTGRDSAVTIESHVSSEPHQILLRAQRIQGAAELDGGLETFDPPVALLKLPLPVPGEAYPSIMKGQGLTVDSRPYALAREAVETPAGMFEDCLRISSRGSVSGALPGPQKIAVPAGSIEETVWFARGVGIVKQLQVLRLQLLLPDGRRIDSEEEKTKILVAYQK
jgi:hypothetical protein